MCKEIGGLFANLRIVAFHIHIHARAFMCFLQKKTQDVRQKRVKLLAIKKLRCLGLCAEFAFLPEISAIFCGFCLVVWDFFRTFAYDLEKHFINIKSDCHETLFLL